MRTILKSALTHGDVHSRPTADNATKPVPQRKMSFDPQTTETLERRLVQRPEKQELVERNILKGAYTLFASTPTFY